MHIHGLMLELCDQASKTVCLQMIGYLTVEYINKKLTLVHVYICVAE